MPNAFATAWLGELPRVSPACPKLAEKHPRDMRIRAAETNPDPAWMPAFVVDRRHLERMRAAVAL